MKQKPVLNDTQKLEFDLEEATSLIHMAIHRAGIEQPKFEDIGLIVGVLAMNDEIEVVVKFHDGLRQFTRRELGGSYVEEHIPE
ncbi:MULTISPECIES: hypothetical protein [unclassified Idiomarina]|uniref:hypothetical protein n=1 Tax=unclassified Idiomarina TaxID=2614829 RepID=UPI0008F87B6D|nr:MULTISPECIES: hypothetical protein [unclassified Idiomarina]MAD52846.1 hypothetical protein [Idiomarinaceae bacterium]OIN01819.1 hypothetical protein BFR57_07120 [Idiomarina sp. MD25a]|tara:strand:+ start:1746 stop:1997 length:252 start_codon:yes stop_codon:yes gene_type:complete